MAFECDDTRDLNGTNYVYFSYGEIKTNPHYVKSLTNTDAFKFFTPET